MKNSVGYSKYSLSTKIILLNVPLNSELLPKKPELKNATFFSNLEELFIKWINPSNQSNVNEIRITFTILSSTGLPIKTINEGSYEIVFSCE